LLDEYQLDFENPEEIRGQDVQEDHEEDHGRHRRDCARRVEHRAPGR
jgi:hypothetical protein